MRCWRERAVDNQAIVSYTNMVGGQDELVFDGDSVVFDHDGKLLLRGNQFREELLFVDLEMDPLSHVRVRYCGKLSPWRNTKALKEIGEPVRVPHIRLHRRRTPGRLFISPAGNGKARTGCRSLCRRWSWGPMTM